jgi:phosphatidylinositol alpha-1,6-mannosyltransferase
MEIKNKKLLFVYLNSFSATGGIEKFNACLMKSLHENSKILGFHYHNISFIDTETDTNYLPANLLYAFGKRRLRAFLYACKTILQTDVVILGHINLLVLALFACFLPKKKIIFVAHGIEVWQNLQGWKRMILKKLDLILAVSEYTKQKMAEKQGLDKDKILVFHNTLNPFFELPKEFAKPAYLLQRYEIATDQKILLTLARLSFSEQYKGYDTVIKAMPEILKTQPNTLYIIAGKYDEGEYARIKGLIAELRLQKHVKLVGFVKNEELIDHYLLADTFIMPSKGEGFGIVFLEAMACGLPVIAGNVDGSVDALKNGVLGTLINPDNKAEITEAVLRNFVYSLDKNEKINLQSQLLKYFGFEEFKNNTLLWLKLLKI